MIALSLNPVDTKSKSKFSPSTFFVNEYTGTSEFAELNLYWLVGIESIVPLFTGLPNFSFSDKAAFKTFVNCSFQFALPESFQVTVCPDKFKLLLSTIFCVVDTATNFNKPFAVWFLVAL